MINELTSAARRSPSPSSEPASRTHKESKKFVALEKKTTKKKTNPELHGNSFERTAEHSFKGMVEH